VIEKRRIGDPVQPCEQLRAPVETSKRRPGLLVGLLCQVGGEISIRAQPEKRRVNSRVGPLDHDLGCLAITLPDSLEKALLVDPAPGGLVFPFRGWKPRDTRHIHWTHVRALPKPEYATSVKRCLPVVLFLVAACRPAETTFDPAAHAQEIRKWQENRDSRLRREDGWLSLVALHWLEPGKNKIEPFGTLTLQNGTVTLDPDPDAKVTIDQKPATGKVELRDDSDDNGPTIVHAGKVNFQIIKRGDRFGVRVKDPDAKTRLEFKRLEYFPIDPKWRVVAQFQPYQPARQIPIVDVTGMVSNQTVPGALVFDVDGESYRLDAIAEPGSRELFVILKDATSRDATYPAGRYLYVPRPGVDGKLIVDFNKAYSPPCAFTPYATCPLPPRQNRLPLRIEAGEKYSAH
jgi:uncharacterized protein